MTTPPPAPDAVVRSARPADAPAIGAVHAATWLADYTELLPGRAASVDADALAQAWAGAIEAPPTPQHRVMVATAGPTLVGFVAFGPSADGDAHPVTDAELVALHVDPSARGAGHGSRLLNAAADVLGERGYTGLRAWVPEPDEVRLRFLTAAGFAADGATRLLDAAGDGTTRVREVRLVVGLAPAR